MGSFGQKEHLNTADLITSGLKKDLHIHTCYSDGMLTPQEVVDKWAADGYELIAITDHDGIEGSTIGMDYAVGKSIKILPGIEFDSEDELGSDMHILGYGIDYHCDELRNALLEIVSRRDKRNDSLMKALNDMGYGITYDDLNKINDGRYIGKPTFALIIKNKGFIKNPQEAFKTIFKDPAIRRIVKETYSTKHVIDLIHKAGGLAFMAHPMEQRRVNESFEAFKPRMFEILDRVVDYGIDGIECYHPSASAEQAQILRNYAEEHGLLISEGSDFHSAKHKRDYSRFHRP